MKARTWRLLAGAAAAAAALYLGFAWSEHSRREAYIYRCNEQGEGGMFTSRQYCEALYEESKTKRAAARRR